MEWGKDRRRAGQVRPGSLPRPFGWLFLWTLSEINWSSCRWHQTVAVFIVQKCPHTAPPQAPPFLSLFGCLLPCV